jgi:PhnB protein
MEKAEMYDPEKGYPRVVPYILYDDVRQAVRWLGEVLGLRELIRFETPDGVIRHAEVESGGFIVTLGSSGGRFAETRSITVVFVEDVDVICQRAVDAGGSVVDQAKDQPWGLRQALIADPEGQRWEVSQHLEDVPPQEWGAELLGSMPG